MKRLLVGIIAGVVLGASSVALAQSPLTNWQQNGFTYQCEGIASSTKERTFFVQEGVKCKSWRYEFGVTGNLLYVKDGLQIMSCDKLKRLRYCRTKDLKS